MQLRRLACLVLVLAPICLAGEQASAQGPQAGLLQSPLLPVRLTQRDVSLSKALELVGTWVRNGYVLFGIEVHLRNGKEPTVGLDIPPGSTLGDGLRQVFRQLPGYRYEIAGQHLINVHPAGAKADTQNILNMHVERCDIVEQQPDTVLGAPELFIPELKKRLAPARTGPPQPSGYAGPVMRSARPTISLHLQNATVRQILNAVSEATEHPTAQDPPLGWAYYFRCGAPSSASDVHKWTWFASVPSNWKAKSGPSVPR